MTLGFKRQFAPFVLDGSKTHTIRAGSRWRAGMRCDCFIDPRQKTMKLLGRWPCVRVEPIRIEGTKTGRGANLTLGVRVRIDGEWLSFDETEAFLQRDGFRKPPTPLTAVQMAYAFWRDRLPFEGQVIHWDFANPIEVKP